MVSFAIDAQKDTSCRTPPFLRKCSTRERLSRSRWLSKDFGPLKLLFRALWDSTLAEAARIVDYDDLEDIDIKTHQIAAAALAASSPPSVAGPRAR
jgi:hypothetical protein